jgi:acylphosphatase
LTRVTVVIRGRVQGVAFRYYTRHRALELGVTGWVRNLPDGRVEGLFEGDATAVEGLVEWCHSGPPSAQVECLDVTDGAYSGEFSTFMITT